MAEQLFKFAASAKWDLRDDTSLVNLYLPHDLSLCQKASISIEDIQTLLLGIHTAASIEAVNFARDLEADWPSLASVVKDAAGASKAFEILLKSVGPGQALGQFTHKTFEELCSGMVSVSLDLIRRITD